MTRYLPEARSVNALGAFKQGQEIRSNQLAIKAQEQQLDKKNYLEGLWQGVAGGNQNAINRLKVEDPAKMKTYLSLQHSGEQQAKETQERDVKYMGQIAATVLNSAPEDKAAAWEMGLGLAENAGKDVSELPQKYTPESAPQIDQLLNFLVNQSRDVKDIIGNDPSAPTASSSDPSAVREYKYYQSLSAPEQQEFLNVKRNIAKEGVRFTEEGNIETIPGILEAKSGIEEAKKRGADTGKLDVERRKNLVTASSALKSLESKSKVVTDTIDKALDTINIFSTGYGSWFDFVPNTDARKLKNYIDTIKANVGFDKLQQMRDNSPTGGALGQVSELENKLLQAVNGSLDPGQRDQLEENLKVIKEFYPQLVGERKLAFEADYGQYIPDRKKPNTIDLPRFKDKEELTKKYNLD
jgi:hypothetical protein